MMKTCGSFLIGMSAGMALGAGVVMMNPKRGKRMKRQVGQSFQKFGTAVEDALDAMMEEMR